MSVLSHVGFVVAVLSRVGFVQCMFCRGGFDVVCFVVVGFVWIPTDWLVGGCTDGHRATEASSLGATRNAVAPTLEQPLLQTSHKTLQHRQEQPLLVQLLQRTTTNSAPVLAGGCKTAAESVLLTKF